MVRVPFTARYKNKAFYNLIQDNEANLKRDASILLGKYRISGKERDKVINLLVRLKRVQQRAIFDEHMGTMEAIYTKMCNTPE